MDRVFGSDNWIDEGNPVRAIDAFVEKLDLSGLGFDGVAPEATGRPSYHPSGLFLRAWPAFPSRGARWGCLIESLGFLVSKYASRLPPISPHAWPSSCPGCRESDILISKPSEASDVLARKFDVGQSVYLRPNLSTRNAAFGVYEIRATLPAEDGQFRYRIKSQLELHERVVKESELSKA